MDEKKVVAFPVLKLEDVPSARMTLRMIRNGLARPNDDHLRAMAAEVLRLWGDPDWNRY